MPIEGGRLIVSLCVGAEQKLNRKNNSRVSVAIGKIGGCVPRLGLHLRTETGTFSTWSHAGSSFFLRETEGESLKKDLNNDRFRKNNAKASSENCMNRLPY